MIVEGMEDRKPLEDEEVVRWCNDIDSAKRREKEWRKEGDEIIDTYRGKRKDKVPFNILFSNTQTLFPALYSTVPRGVVRRRYPTEDPIAKAAAQAGERMAIYLLDTNVEGYETYDEGMRAATLDALLPGRGITSVKYDADIGQLPSKEKDAPGTPYKKGELVCCNTRSWNRAYFGYAKKWSKVPWIAYEEYIDRKEAERLFGEEVAKALVYTVEDRDTEEGENKASDERRGETKTTCIYQIWDREGGRKIRYVSEGHKQGYLKVIDDPLGLTGFFDCPRPLELIEKSNDLAPVAPYKLYENQAEELNRLTVRINRLISAIKARGVYDSELGDDLKTLLQSDENDLVPSDKNSSLAAEKGLDNAIWMWPVDKLIQVLRELYVARESCKQVIFEIMGLADIMRGSSQASETLGAQQIKQQWGGLRLKSMQKEVQRYARDILRLMLEVAATKFSEETWARMTGLPYTTSQELRQLQALAQAAQMSGQQLDPQVQAKLQAPSWPAVLGLLKDDLQRSYKVDIETNSTVEPEAVEDQKHIAEVMTALGQFLQSVGPMVQQGIMPFQAAQAMMLSVTRRFRMGDEIEDHIKAMKPPQPQEDGKAKAEQAKMQAEMQMQQADHQAKQQEQALNFQMEQKRMQLEEEKLAREAEYQREEHAQRMAELRAKAALAEVVAQSKMQVALVTARTREAAASRPQKETTQ